MSSIRRFMEAASTILAIPVFRVHNRAKVSPLSKTEPITIFLVFVPDDTIRLETWPLLGIHEPHLQKQQDLLRTVSVQHNACTVPHQNRD